MSCCTPNYTLPSFNLTANVWRSDGNAGYANPDANIVCTIRAGMEMSERYNYSVQPDDPQFFVTWLLAPLGSDLIAGHRLAAGQSYDLLEVPIGSKRFYRLLWIEHVALGYPNEHLLCAIKQRNVPSGDFRWDGDA